MAVEYMAVDGSRAVSARCRYGHTPGGNPEFCTVGHVIPQQTTVILSLAGTLVTVTGSAEAVAAVVGDLQGMGAESVQ
jgi:hypothetical protein